jgi:hypothetical protein
MAIRIEYGARDSETQEEAAKRFWTPAAEYAYKLFRDKTERNKVQDKAGIEP